METSGVPGSHPWARIINLVILSCACVFVLVMPLKKEIWYDETVSILCANGFSHDTPDAFAKDTLITSARLSQLNTAQNVFDATVSDNGNSYLYNMWLHGVISVAGHSLSAYMASAKIVSVLSLILFFFLARLLFGESLFTGLSVLLLAIDVDFLGMSHEIRAYALGILMVLAAAFFLYLFLFRARKPAWLGLAALFSVGALLSHFLSSYMILLFVAGLLAYQPRLLLTWKNVAAIFLPLSLLAVYFWYAYPGLQTMARQNQQIQLQAAQAGFSVAEVFWRALHFLSVMCKVLFPAFSPGKPVLLISVALVVGLFIAGLKWASGRAQKIQLVALFLPGFFAVVFLSALCLKSHHYTALYHRYFSFCLPFCALYVAFLTYVLWGSRLPGLARAGLSSIVWVPAVVLFFISMRSSRPIVKYNHVAVAAQIVEGHISRISVPEWKDALLLHSFLPQGYNLTYIRTAGSPDFILFSNTTGPVHIPVIRIDR